MTVATLSDFRNKFPEFASLSDAVAQGFLDDAALIHSVRKRSHLYLAAHFAALVSARGDQPDGGQGEVKSESIGPLRTQYMTQAEDGGEAFFTGTKYGRIFLALEKRSPSMAITARVFG